MIDEQKLRQGLQKLLEGTVSAIRDRLTDDPTLEANLRARHAAAVQAERTEGSAKGYNTFSEDAITQASVHWLLGCVFVRFLEDNGWLDERNSNVAWLSGPGDRMAIARDRRTLFLRPDPSLTDRDYLLHVFGEVAKLPGVAGLFDPKHNPLYALQPTAQGAARIVEFFQKVDPDSNELVFDFTDVDHETRFLGDLYQNLSESARKRYALCQTPGFVIDFILNRTLTPALDAFGLAAVRMIDPSCGSGHFLLESFARIYRLWQDKEPGTNPPALVQRALDAVYGVDLNPFAIEITRFRLLIAALGASGISRLKEAPNFRFNVAAGDSLLHGARVGGGGIQRGLLEDRMRHFYDTEDAGEVERILSQPYHVVVGNPPYINVSDSILREAYRSRFSTCHGKYQLGVPFTERFFDLTLRSDSVDEGPAGWMGMIVSNAFMRSAFGKPLIEQFLSRRDLTHVIDTSGLNLPGHGTPTVILLARNRPDMDTRPIRAVRGIVGVSNRDEDLANSPTWREIIDGIEHSKYEGSHVSVADVPRSVFASHPWTTGGGGAAELKAIIDLAGVTTLEASGDPGVQTLTLADDVFIRPLQSLKRAGLVDSLAFSTGDDIRDWTASTKNHIYNPGDEPPRSFWPFRTTLSRRKSFMRTQIERGLRWWDYGMVVRSRLDPPLIALGYIVTHNHFALCTKRQRFDQHALVIRPLTSGIRTPKEMLGSLNSSVGCFWLRQVCHDKGGGGVGGGLASETWERFMCVDASKIKDFPLPSESPTELTQRVLDEIESRDALLPSQLIIERTPTRESLNQARLIAGNHLGRAIALQEELDWHTYALYGIVDEDLTALTEDIPSLKLGERTFEVLLARADPNATWFTRHNSTPITELPDHWSKSYRELIERRMTAIETNRNLALIERPEYKRRWNLPSWQDLESFALKNWLLDRIEANTIWKDNKLVSSAQLRDALAQDQDWISVAELYEGEPIQDLDAFVIALVTTEAVPFLPVLRFADAGIRKRADWEEVWRLQREEDAGNAVQIPTPPKYVSKDFKNADCWRLRGGLDVPKERFTLYPGLERDSDRTPVLAWAGWSPLEQARALAAYYQRMRTEEGWEPNRLKPILAGLLDLREWLKQWHDELDQETGLHLGTYFSEFAETQCQDLGFSIPEVRNWQTTAGQTTSRKKSKVK